MLKTRLLNAVFYLAILGGLVLMFWLVLPRLASLHSPPRIASTPVILKQVQTLSQLVTVKWVMEKVVICDDPVMLSFLPMGESRVLLVAHGIVLAGIDMKEIKEGDIQTSKDKIILKLPPARVFHTFLDEKLTQVIDYKKGLLRSFNKDLEQNARDQAVLDISRAAREGGILKDADERARTQLTNLFQQLGFKEVEFRSP
ncbi:MAG TPA: DUF4230 domain-containing protein [Verrucomicrobiae bacterium]|nr:DUF4230 domain-containing protein [Verrucomicrobiae bacterium]